MTLQRILIVTTAVLMLTMLLSTESSAQSRLKRHQPVGRFLGLGWGLSGYHYCNPGPNSDYYNPYTVRNSVLMSPHPTATNGQPAYPELFGTSTPGIPEVPQQALPVIDHSTPPAAAPIDPSSAGNGRGQLGFPVSSVPGNNRPSMTKSSVWPSQPSTPTDFGASTSPFGKPSNSEYELNQFQPVKTRLDTHRFAPVGNSPRE